MSKAFSFGRFAKLMGVTRPAVSKAVKCKRLSKSVGRTSNGQPCIIDFELARQEWIGNSSRPVTAGRAPVTAVDLERFTLDEVDGVLVLAVTPNEDTDFDAERDSYFPMADSTAIELGRWLQGAATDRIEEQRKMT